MNILILEDDLQQAAGLYRYIKNYNDSIDIYKTTTYEKALLMADNIPIDIFMLDIQLPGEKSGLDFGRYLRSAERYSNTPIIFLTGMNEYIFDAVNEIHCYGYLPKPYSAGDVRSLLMSLSFSGTEETEQTIIIKDINGIAFRILPSEIDYIAAENRRLHIYTINNEYYTGYCTLYECLEKFPGFLQIHKKYLVNPKHITNYDRTSNYIAIRETTLPVGRKYKNELNKYF